MQLRSRSREVLVVRGVRPEVVGEVGVRPEAEVDRQDVEAVVEGLEVLVVVASAAGAEVRRGRVAGIRKMLPPRSR